jgi:hypothetical protein
MPALLFAIVTLFYWKLTLSDQYSWMESPDYAYQVLPWYQFQAGEWHAGRIPLWDPYAWSGQSLIGQAAGSGLSAELAVRGPAAERLDPAAHSTGTGC